MYTGFSLLHDAGEIALSQQCDTSGFRDPSRPQHLRDARHAHLSVVVNGTVTVYYDCHDSHEIDEPAAERHDVYFKRSYDRSLIPAPCRAFVIPLGLFYRLDLPQPDRFEWERIEAFSPGVSPLPRARPTVEAMWALPDRCVDPRVLFITRTWDPFDVEDRPVEKVAERIRLNQTRVRCIEVLRREFGGRFLGGLLHDAYAVRHHPEALLRPERGPDPQVYFEQLRQHAIGVATTGLHGSIGGKMGEYVAFSKAIVSERPHCEVPGPFAPENNYLQFDTPEECATAVERLLTDESLRFGMMQANRDYYTAYLSPEALIRRTLRIALSVGSDRPTVPPVCR